MRHITARPPLEGLGRTGTAVLRVGIMKVDIVIALALLPAALAASHSANRTAAHCTRPTAPRHSANRTASHSGHGTASHSGHGTASRSGSRTAAHCTRPKTSACSLANQTTTTTTYTYAMSTSTSYNWHCLHLRLLFEQLHRECHHWHQHILLAAPEHRLCLRRHHHHHLRRPHLCHPDSQTLRDHGKSIGSAPLPSVAHPPR